MIGNSINHQDDNRLEELNHRGMSLQDDDTASIKSYGSHKNRPFKDESHKGSAETMDGEEKRDVSKEDLGIDEGKHHRHHQMKCEKNAGAKIANPHFSSIEIDGEGEEEEEGNPLEMDGIINAAEDEIIEETPADCFPEHVYVRFPFLTGDEDAPFWQGWANLRLKTFQLIENKYFETAVITMILLSSLALVCSTDFSQI
jgi:voltage-gated sodium channel type II alpha